MEMEQLIQQYGVFEVKPLGHVILLTGATGSLGAYLASLLASRTDVERVYCLIRASTLHEASRRLEASLEERQIKNGLNEAIIAKLVALPSDLSLPLLGLPDSTIQSLRETLTVVIHSAWAVNFNFRLSSFNDCMASTRHLLDFSTTCKHRPSFNFCSSVSSVAKSPEAIITEALPKELDYAANMGYAQSKLVAEHMCINAAKAGITARVLRIGQICGDTKHGIWNASEAFPLMFQTANTLKSLPQIEEKPQWLPIDVVATTIIDLALPRDVPVGVFNIVNPQGLSWSEDLLPMLRRAGLEFEAVPAAEWIARLRSSTPNPTNNPPYKLLDYFSDRFGRPGRVDVQEWDTRKTEQYSRGFRGAGIITQDLINKIVTSLGIL